MLRQKMVEPFQYFWCLIPLMFLINDVASFHSSLGFRLAMIKRNNNDRIKNYYIRASTNGNSKRAPIALHSSSKDFDYSSPTGWDSFYKEMEEQKADDEEEFYEWHSSIPLERIASYIPDASYCVMVGCGNSKLPQVVLDYASKNAKAPPQLVLLDTSQVCIAQLQRIYGSSVDYICGDATKLSSLLSSSSSATNAKKSTSVTSSTMNTIKRKVDIIVDKGLTDAILCDEGWNGPLKTLFHEASKVLSSDSGIYLLISYRLPTSTKQFLKEVGTEVGLIWEFDLEPDSTSRVCISRARKIQ